MQVQETAVQPLTESRPASPSTAQRPAAAGPESRTERAENAPRPEANEPEEHSLAYPRNSRARLSLDPDLHRVFVEIIDPKTGDVVSRFPPEQLITHIDEVLEQTGQKTNLQDLGLIIDETI